MNAALVQKPPRYRCRYLSKWSKSLLTVVGHLVDLIPSLTLSSHCKKKSSLQWKLPANQFHAQQIPPGCVFPIKCLDGMEEEGSMSRGKLFILASKWHLCKFPQDGLLTEVCGVSMQTFLQSVCSSGPRYSGWIKWRGGCGAESSSKKTAG